MLSEKIVIKIENLLKKRNVHLFVMFIMILGPFSFLPTVYDVFFGSPEIQLGLKAQLKTFIFLVFVNIVSYISLIPTREKGKIMKGIILTWIIIFLIMVIGLLV